MPEVEIFDKGGQFLGTLNDENQTVEISEAWKQKSAKGGKKGSKGSTTYPPKGGSTTYPPKGSPKAK